MGRELLSSRIGQRLGCGRRVKSTSVISWNGFQELLLEANAALLGMLMFYWSKPMAGALNTWAARCYERFPKLKSLLGSQNAGTELNYRITYIYFRVLGAFIFCSAVGFIILFLRLFWRLGQT